VAGESGKAAKCEMRKSEVPPAGNWKSAGTGTWNDIPYTGLHGLFGALPHAARCARAVLADLKPRNLMHCIAFGSACHAVCSHTRAISCSTDPRTLFSRGEEAGSREERLKEYKYYITPTTFAFCVCRGCMIHERDLIFFPSSRRRAVVLKTLALSPIAPVSIHCIAFLPPPTPHFVIEGKLSSNLSYHSRLISSSYQLYHQISVV
jgi:hypothetical protein